MSSHTIYEDDAAFFEDRDHATPQIQPLEIVRRDGSTVTLRLAQISDEDDDEFSLGFVVVDPAGPAVALTLVRAREAWDVTTVGGGIPPCSLHVEDSGVTPPGDPQAVAVLVYNDAIAANGVS